MVEITSPQKRFINLNLLTLILVFETFSKTFFRTSFKRLYNVSANVLEKHFHNVLKTFNLLFGRHIFQRLKTGNKQIKQIGTSKSPFSYTRKTSILDASIEPNQAVFKISESLS